MNQIELRPAQRDDHHERTARQYLDFFVDGKALSDLFGKKLDLVSCLSRWHYMGEVEKSLNRLLLLEPADFSDNRRSLYICPECGDLNCGAVSLLIVEQQNQIVWKEFAFQNNYEKGISRLYKMEPFYFNKKQYVNELSPAITMLLSEGGFTELNDLPN